MRALEGIGLFLYQRRMQRYAIVSRTNANNNKHMHTLDSHGRHNEARGIGYAYDYVRDHCL